MRCRIICLSTLCTPSRTNITSSTIGNRGRKNSSLRREYFRSLKNLISSFGIVTLIYTRGFWLCRVRDGGFVSLVLLASESRPSSYTSPCGTCVSPLTTTSILLSFSLPIQVGDRQFLLLLAQRSYVKGPIMTSLLFFN